MSAKASKVAHKHPGSLLPSVAGNPCNLPCVPLPVPCYMRAEAQSLTSMPCPRLISHRWDLCAPKPMNSASKAARVKDLLQKGG